MPDTIRDLMAQAYENLIRHMREQGRRPAPGATPRIEFDDVDFTFHLTIDTVPDA